MIIKNILYNILNKPYFIINYRIYAIFHRKGLIKSILLIIPYHFSS